MPTFSSNSAVIARYAGAVYGLVLNNATLNECLNVVSQGGSGTMEVFLNAVYMRDCSTLTTASVAASIVTNLGITDATNAAIATSYITGQLNAVAVTARGAVVENILNLYAGLASDAANPTWNADAAAYNGRVSNAVTYGQNTANTSTATFASLAPAATQNFTLTTGVDNGAAFTGGAGNDVFNASLDTTLATPTSTWTALDTIDGGAGTDTFNLTAITDFSVPAGATVSNIENVVLTAAAKVGTFTANGTGNVDLSTSLAGATSLTVTGGTQTDFKAPTTAAVTLTNATGGIEVIGGISQTVALSAQGGNLNLLGSTGAITVTSTAQGANTMVIDGGTSVKVTSAGTNPGGTSGAITIGATTAPTGAVTVTNALTNVAAAATNSTGGVITVTGGSTVSVTQTAVQAAMTTASTNSKVVQGAVSVTGSTATTEVTSVEAAAVTAVDTVLAVAAVTETSVATFAALTAGQTQILNGLTFTAGAAGTTAAQTAFAFANLDAGAKQGYSTLGTYTGTFGTATAGVTAYTTGAVTGTSTVTFSSTTGINATDIADTGTGTDPTIVLTAGVAAVTATGKGGIDQAKVEIADAKYGVSTNSITKATVNGFAGTSYVKSDALTTLSLANSTAGSTFNVYDNTATTLNLTVDTLGAATISLDAGAAKYTTLNITTTGGNSGATALTAAAVTALTVGGTKSISLAGSTLTELLTVVVKDSAGLTLTSPAKVTSIDTTATTGTVTVTAFDATVGKYTGGAGVDAVTITAAAPTKVIDLGDGNDTLTIASGVTSTTAALLGGLGTDTLVMAAADVATASATATFGGFIDSFEKISVLAVAAAASKSVDLSNLDGASYAITAGGTAGTAMVDKITIGGAPEAGDIYTAVINGRSVSYTATAADTTTTLIAAGLFGAINADPIAGKIVTGAAGAAGILNLTSNVVGNAITVTSSTTDAGTLDATATRAAVTGNGSLGDLTFTKMANAGTLELVTGAGNTTVTMTDATGTSDSFNLVAKVSTADINFGKVGVANVETLALTATDTSTTAAINTATLDLADVKATSLTITGNANVTLTNTANVALTKIDGSAMTGALTVAASGTVAETISGGSGNDVLVASSGSTADVLIGGAGNDTLYANAGMVTLTGGTGFDTFVIKTASTNVNSYATITDPTKGDYIQFTDTAGAETFNQSKISLANTAVFQDYANAAITLNTVQGGISWFQYGTDTYIIQEAGANTSASFTNGKDFVVKLTGLVDLSLASFDTGAIEVRLG